ncbi:replication-associated recombination protein A [Streptococcus sp. NLN64]|uniref:AAA family ATPase n=1 Tax=Streptococcus sp. NLN64 TaxID=2822799 RepID=UPI0018C90B16|nr:replication-associated recombination protein A [Streptococcus sp. NLN64]
MNQNLALNMRPTNLDQIVGQSHLVGPGKVLRRMVEAGKLFSMILYGPPGIGKTSIASALAGSTGQVFRTFNATTDTKQRMKEIAEEARFSGSLVLLLDEIHRLNKDKQDFFLPLLESGQLTIIGATTENPFYSINPAIRSRLQIFELKPLTTDEMKAGIQAALQDPNRGFDFPVQLTSEALTFLSQVSNGDLRAAYNTLELAALSTPKNEEGQVHLDLNILKECLQSSHLTLDKDGDGHYDLLSALQKSIRGSDVDASLHYGARLIKGGDLDSLARRLTVIAYEDIGLANPQAQIHTVTGLEAAKRIGLPEARIIIANIIVDLALSPKSNSAYAAMNQALADLENFGSLPIPDHLRSGTHAGNKLQPYLYPHDYPDKWVDQDYLPTPLKNRHYFQPNQTGRYEKALAARKDWIDKAKAKT